MVDTIVTSHSRSASPCSSALCLSQCDWVAEPRPTIASSTMSIPAADDAKIDIARSASGNRVGTHAIRSYACRWPCDPLWALGEVLSGQMGSTR
jgi:hypothetical protein